MQQLFPCLVFSGQTIANVANTEIWAQFPYNYVNNLISSSDFPRFLIVLEHHYETQLFFLLYLYLMLNESWSEALDKEVWEKEEN